MSSSHVTYALFSQDSSSELVSEDVSSDTFNSVELTPVHKISDSQNGADGLEINEASGGEPDLTIQIESTVCPMSDYRSPQQLSIPGTVSQNDDTDVPTPPISGLEIEVNDSNSSNTGYHDAIAPPSIEKTEPEETSVGDHGERDSEPVCCETLHSSHSL